MYKIMGCVALVLRFGFGTIITLGAVVMLMKHVSGLKGVINWIALLWGLCLLHSGVTSVIDIVKRRMAALEELGDFALRKYPGTTGFVWMFLAADMLYGWYRYAHGAAGAAMVGASLLSMASCLVIYKCLRTKREAEGHAGLALTAVQLPVFLLMYGGVYGPISNGAVIGPSAYLPPLIVGALALVLCEAFRRHCRKAVGASKP